MFVPYFRLVLHILQHRFPYSCKIQKYHCVPNMFLSMYFPRHRLVVYLMLMNWKARHCMIQCKSWYIEPHRPWIKFIFRSRNWRHNGCDGVSNHAGAGEFPAQMASNAENVSIWWCHHVSWRKCFIAILTTFRSFSSNRYLSQIVW